MGRFEFLAVPGCVDCTVIIGLSFDFLYSEAPGELNCLEKVLNSFSFLLRRSSVNKGKEIFALSALEFKVFFSKKFSELSRSSIRSCDEIITLFLLFIVICSSRSRFSFSILLYKSLTYFSLISNSFTVYPLLYLM